MKKQEIYKSITRMNIHFAVLNWNVATFTVRRKMICTFHVISILKLELQYQCCETFFDLAFLL